MVTVNQAGDVVDPLTVRAHLRDGGRQAGGRPGVYLAELDAPVISSAPFYAGQVRETSVRRRVRDQGCRLQQRVESDLDTKPEELVADVRYAQNGESAAVPTLWLSLDELIAGLYPGQLVRCGLPGRGEVDRAGEVANYITRP